MVRGLECDCAGASACPDNAENGTCVTQPGGYCFVKVEELIDENGLLELERTAGCLPPDESGLMQCKGSQVPHLHPKAIECCADGDLCNRRLRPQLPEPPPEFATDSPAARPPGAGPQPTLLVGAALCVALVAFLAAFLLLFRRRRRAGKRPPSPPAPPPRARAADLSSGSGSGLPLLVQRTVAKQIQMIESIGRGRYGEVWLARWRGERVAVKVFHTTEEASWFRETEIYQTVLMRHENVLGFIAADIDGAGSRTRMLLIAEHHERGSLYDHLRAHTLDRRALAALAHSLAAGLAHLHMDIFGTKGKPAVAHRDLKSRNVLVKRDGRCAIADFGLAARHAGGAVDAAPAARAPTPRYAAPEVLAGALDPADFEQYKAADVYSMALVLWEMCRRTATEAGAAAAYAAPYHDALAPGAGEPGAAEMRAALAGGRRPALAPHWRAGAGALAALAALLPECWHARPAARLTALRVKKTLARFEADAAVKLV